MKETLPFLAILIVVIASPAQTQVSDEATAHVKCFANLSQALFTGVQRKENPGLEAQRQEHERQFVKIGRKDLAGADFEFGVDHYLGGYEQRVYDSQIQKLYCDNPSHYGHCDSWASTDTSILSKIGMKFYKGENCELLLR
tara:strand:- start:861 stop:1283 length:423 start_codon:yes stop_codon:yes gene_type:complete